MLRVISDALSEADEQRVTLLASLDMTAAVDHSLLLMRLRWKFGLEKTVLEWMTSFLTGITQQVAYTGQLSPILPVLYGVPRVSPRPTALRAVYDLPDIQLAIDRLSRCMAEIRS